MSDARDRLREELLVAHARHHRRRRAQRNAVRGGGTLAAVALVAMLAVRLDPAPSPDVPAPDLARGPESTAPLIQIVHTRPGALERFAAPPPRRQITIVDDTTLINTLHDFGYPTGLIRRGHTVQLSADIPIRDPGAQPIVPGVS